MYAETEFLLAVMSQDYERADRLAADMLPGEKRRLADQLREAADRLGVSLAWQ